MWHTVVAGAGGKWVKINEAGRIVGRVTEKEGEYLASYLTFNAAGEGTNVILGRYIFLERAQVIVDEALQPLPRADD